MSGLLKENEQTGQPQQGDLWGECAHPILGWPALAPYLPEVTQDPDWLLFSQLGEPEL